METTQVKNRFKPYRKRPVVIQAKQMDAPFRVETEEGPMLGKPGDYLVIGVQAEPYPCKKEIFEQTYKPAKDQQISTKEELREERAAITTLISRLQDKLQHLQLLQEELDAEINKESECEKIKVEVLT